MYCGGVAGSKTPLAAELDRRGIRYGWMADQLGIKKWTFTRIERGSTRPPADYYERAADILGVDVDAVRPHAAEGLDA